MWVLRACVVGLLLADVWHGHPAPGLSGQRLILLVGSILAGLTWLAWLPAGRVDDRVRVPVLVIGMVGGCLAGLVSPGTGALVLPAVIGVMAGSSLALPIAAGVAACGLATLGLGSLVLTSHGFSLLGATLAVVGGLLAGLWRGQYRLRVEQAELIAAQTQRAEQEHIRAQVLDERTRIAREIHDILAHTLGGLVVQLDAADALLGEGDDPEGGRRLVGDARHLAVAGLEETRPSPRSEPTRWTCPRRWPPSPPARAGARRSVMNCGASLATWLPRPAWRSTARPRKPWPTPASTPPVRPWP
jgi:signal transduction histidine kinase